MTKLADALFSFAKIKVVDNHSEAMLCVVCAKQITSITGTFIPFLNLKTGFEVFPLRLVRPILGDLTAEWNTDMGVVWAGTVLWKGAKEMCRGLNAPL